MFWKVDANLIKPWLLELNDHGFINKLCNDANVDKGKQESWEGDY